MKHAAKLSWDRLKVHVVSSGRYIFYLAIYIKTHMNSDYLLRKNDDSCKIFLA